MAPKRKLSRKAQLRGFAAAKKACSAAAQAAQTGDENNHEDPDFQVDDDGDDGGDDGGDDVTGESMPVEVAGAAAKRQRDAFNHRRSASYLRGVGPQATSMAAWLQTGWSRE